MKLLQRRYIAAITILLVGALVGLPLFACVSPHNDSTLPDMYYAQHSIDSDNSLLPPSLMNYGVFSFCYNPRDSRRMSDAETAARSMLSGTAAYVRINSVVPHDNQLLAWVSLRRHGFAYTGGEEDPYSPSV